MKNYIVNFRIEHPEYDYSETILQNENIPIPRINDLIEINSDMLDEDAKGIFIVYKVLWDLYANNKDLILIDVYIKRYKA